MHSDLPWEFEEPGDELRDEEYPDADSDHDDPDDGLSETVSCPQCGAEIYEDAVQCPVCGGYVTEGVGENRVWSGRPGWWIVLGLLGSVAVIAMLVLALN